MNCAGTPSSIIVTPDRPDQRVKRPLGLEARGRLQQHQIELAFLPHNHIGTKRLVEVRYQQPSALAVSLCPEPSLVADIGGGHGVRADSNTRRQLQHAETDLRKRTVRAAVGQTRDAVQ